jgi:hypothetical protein
MANADLNIRGRGSIEADFRRLRILAIFNNAEVSAALGRQLLIQYRADIFGCTRKIDCVYHPPSVLKLSYA